jgi:MFS family permease
MSRAALEANIWKFGVYSFIDHIRLIWMITTLYLLWLGFDFTNIGLFETIFAIVIVALEMPTGALADLIGRKKSLMISAALNAIGFTLIGLMNDPSQYYLIALVMGAAWSFCSGAEVALLYDTVKKLGCQKEYKKIRGRINAVNQIASIIGVFTGPALFLINPRLGFLCTGAIYIIGLLILATLKEPTPPPGGTIREHWQQAISSLQFTVRHSRVLWLVGFFFVTMLGVELFYDFWQQPLLVENGVPVAMFGILLAVMMGIKGIVSYFAHVIESRLQESYSLAIIILAQISVFLAFSLGNVWLVLGALAVLYGVMAFQEILFEDYINTHIESSRRASVLSAKSLIYNLCTAGLYVSIGMLLDTHGRSVVLIGFCGFLVIGGLVLYVTKPINVSQGTA